MRGEKKKFPAAMNRKIFCHMTWAKNPDPNASKSALYGSA